jgi:uncharacterized phage-associated protein
MKYLKLVKLLYIADREALAKWGRPITTDRYVSMKEGPVVSNVYHLIGSEPMPSQQSFWHKYIKTVAEWDVELLSDPATDELSQAEEDLLHQVFETHGHNNRWNPGRRDPQIPPSGKTQVRVPYPYRTERF